MGERHSKSAFLALSGKESWEQGADALTRREHDDDGYNGSADQVLGQGVGVVAPN